ncbi:MAG: PocR ligand-binding domain-containing protein, partial [Victivallaceae bacterium]
CRIMQESYFGEEKCRRLDAEKQRECRELGETICYRCHAGLQEVISPVIVYGQVAGFVVIGQFRLSDNPPPFLNDADALRAYFELPRIAENELGNLLDMLKMLIDYIVSKELIGFTGDLRFDRINQYLDRHYAGTVTLKQLAKHLACSESSLTHYLHDEHRTSFKKLLTAKRLAAAEKLMRSHPELTIAEVAHQVGYRDQCYFSRVYRAARRRPPGEGRSFAAAQPGK